MATIGLGYVLEGLAQAAWGVEVRRLDLGIDFPIMFIADAIGIFISALDLTTELLLHLWSFHLQFYLLKRR